MADPIILEPIVLPEIEKSPMEDVVYDPVSGITLKDRWTPNPFRGYIWSVVYGLTGQLASNPVLLLWDSGHTYFQVEWRIKYRFAPYMPDGTPMPDGTTYSEGGNVLGVYDSNVDECWTEYPEDFTHRPRGSSGGWKYEEVDTVDKLDPNVYGATGRALHGEFTHGYDYMTQGYLFDAETWQFRVRPYAFSSADPVDEGVDEWTDEYTEGGQDYIQPYEQPYTQEHRRVGDWVYQEIKVVYAPYISDIRVSYNEETGHMVAESSTTWARYYYISANEMRFASTIVSELGKARAIANSSCTMGFGNAVYDSETNLFVSEAELPIEGDTTDRVAYLVDSRIGTSDGGGWGPVGSVDPSFYHVANVNQNNPWASGSIYAPITPYIPPSGMDLPVWDVSVSGVAIEITVSNDAVDPDADYYRQVDITARWIDANEVEHTASVPATQGETGWDAVLSAVPYDTEVYLSAACYRSDKCVLSSYEVSVRVPSNGAFTWSYGAESISLKFDAEPSYTYTPEGEAIKPAGRELPVSRYGKGGTRSVTLTGNAINPMFGRGGIWRPGLKKLEQPHDWSLRMPGGAFYRVRVDSVDCKEEVKTVDWKIAVDVSMAEVDGGLV